MRSKREDFGNSVVLRLQRAGFGDLGEGTVYPALSRLEANGLLGSRLLRSTAGPARKYYAIADRGRDELTRGLTAWADLARAVDGVLPRSTASAPEEGESR